MFRSPSRSLVVAVVLLACTGVAPASATRFVRHISISDWISAQGVRIVAWQARTGPQVDPPVLGDIGRVDYAGGRAAFFGLSFGYSASGSVSLTELPDGSGRIIVNLNFQNAITWGADANLVPIYAYSPAELAGDPSLSPGLSNGHLQAQYTVPDAEVAELNLAAVVFDGAGTIETLLFSSDGSGPLRSGFGVTEGTPGLCTIVQAGLFTTGGGGATADQFPAERVDVRLAGPALLSSSPSPSLASSSSLGTGGSTARSTWGQLKARYRDSVGSTQK